MIIAFLYVLLSMILDSVISNFICYQINNISLFTPLFTITSLSIIYKLYNSNNNKYISNIIIFGVIYGLCFVNYPITNIVIFSLIGILNVVIFKYVYNNHINTVLISILNVIIYNVLYYIILRILNIYNYNIWYLFNILRNTIIINIIYSIVTYKIISFIFKKNKKRII